MKTQIYYFTGTGNCLAVAQDLAAALGQADLINIAALRDEKIETGADCIGIIFPVYIFGMPIIVREFLRKLRTPEKAYVFAIATYAGLAGCALSQTANYLAASGIKLSAGFLIVMPSNSITLHEAILAQKQQKIFMKAKSRIQVIAGIIARRQEHGIEKQLSLLSPFFSMFYNFFINKLPASDVYFWVNKFCTQCNICVRICAVNNIVLEKDKPKWLHHCQHCLACLQWCPVGAIEYGKNTIGRKRYRHPKIALESMLLKK